MSENISQKQNKGGRFVKGKSGNPKGKPKGTLSKNTTLLKDAILLAAQKAGGGDKDGLVNYLEVQAIENPAPFMSLLGKVLPMQIGGVDDEEGNPTEITFRVLRPSGRDNG